MYEPERPLEPPEPEVVLTCDSCGADICKGDTFYKIPPFWDYCEDCALAWLKKNQARIAGVK